MEITGTVIDILPIKEGVKQNGEPWKSQQFIIQTDDQYPRKVAIELFGEDRINNNLPSHGEKVTAAIDIESHEFNGRWYTSVKSYLVKKAAAAGTATEAPTTQAPPPPVPAEPFDPNDEQAQTDLPF